MDTVLEENSRRDTFECTESQPFLSNNLPQILIGNVDKTRSANSEHEQNQESTENMLSSRRPSAIIAALRRPSQAIALSAAQAVMNQRRYFLGLFQNQSQTSLAKNAETKEKNNKKYNREVADDSLTIMLSALYAKLLVVLGMAFPITEIISSNVEAFFYQGFYIYLYLGSIIFVSYMYAQLATERTLNQAIKIYRKKSNLAINEKPHRYGSFLLRLGAIAFGIGSMVYSSLEFFRYFELKNDSKCQSSVLQAITPATRMLLTLVQVQFIFLNSKHMELKKHEIISRFGLMHMIATNLCEWLYVLVEETKHEIIHLGENHHNTSQNNSHYPSLNGKYCPEGPVMGSLVTHASPFLFPCTIEYSLICAVILFEMWKKVKNFDRNEITMLQNEYTEASKTPGATDKREQFGGQKLIFAVGENSDENHVDTSHHFTVDCSNSHRGLFAGIVVIVLTIISLIMFFVLSNPDKKDGENIAQLEVQIVELILYITTTLAVIIAMKQMRSLKYDWEIGGQQGIGLDNTLLVVAQTGMFIYCMFSIIGCYFTMKNSFPLGLVAEIFSFIQTCLQTMFVLDSWWRRCRNSKQRQKKPGKELITFLIIANMAMWAINTLEKNRAEFRPSHLVFFGDWAWTVITHISMPLAIFYRFHSAICLFEIWKSAYKLKSKNNQNGFH